MKQRYIFFAIFLAALSVSCGEDRPPAKPLTVNALRNMEYLLDFENKGKAILKDGIYHKQYGPKNEFELVVKITDLIAFGDLNGDGVDDAAAVLVAQPGQTSTLYYLMAVVDDHGTYVQAAAEPLGDRIRIAGIAVVRGHVQLAMTLYGPLDTIGSPTMSVFKRYRLGERKFIPL